MLQDKIRNKYIGGKIGVASLMDKIREARQRWFVHVKYMNTDALVRRHERLIVIVLRRGRGRPMENWREVI